MPAAARVIDDIMDGAVTFGDGFAGGFGVGVWLSIPVFMAILLVAVVRRALRGE